MTPEEYNLRIQIMEKAINQLKKEREEDMKNLNTHSGKNIEGYVGKEKNTCPKCGSTKLDYGSCEPAGEHMGYPFTCQGCQNDGWEWYKMTFEETYIPK